MTDVACMILELAKSSANSRVTMNNLIDAFRGSKNKATRDKKLDQLGMFGKGSHLARELVERMFQHLAAADALKEELYENKAGYSNPYIIVGHTLLFYFSTH
jgi:superfamily II DNA helicase RecQ